jgi:hypothetical protein
MAGEEWGVRSTCAIRQTVKRRVGAELDLACEGVKSHLRDPPATLLSAAGSKLASQSE